MQINAQGVQLHMWFFVEFSNVNYEVLLLFSASDQIASTKVTFTAS